MSEPVPRPARRRPLGPQLVAAALVALAAWLLLLFVRGVVVFAMYALGVVLVAGPLLVGRRALGLRTGPARWRRAGALAGVVALGVLLCFLAHLVARHGWLLVALPVGALAAQRGMAAVRRAPR